jgi:hypothetical protein
MGIYQTRHAGPRKVGQANGGANPQIVIAAEVLVQLKNLFKLKDSLGPCLVDANTTQHLTLRGELLQRICHFYSGSEPIKRA